MKASGYQCKVMLVPAAAAKSLQSCPTLCDPIDGSPPGSTTPGILQARTLEWVAISFSNAWKWKVKVKSLSRVWPQRPHGLQPSMLLRPWDFPGKSIGVGCHCLLPLVPAEQYFSAPYLYLQCRQTQPREQERRVQALRWKNTEGNHTPILPSRLPTRMWEKKML